MGGRVTSVAEAKSHPILTGVGPIHTYSGAYKSQPPAEALPLLEVQVLNTFEPGDDVNTEKPIVNAGWTRSFYIAPSGLKKEARVVYTSFGASEDLLDEDARRFLVNSCLWAGGWEEKISSDLDVSIVGGYHPSPYTTGAFYRAGVIPADLAGWDSQVMPAGSKMAGLDNPTKFMASRIDRALSPRPKLVANLEETHPGFKRSNYQPQSKSWKPTAGRSIARKEWSSVTSKESSAIEIVKGQARSEEAVSYFKSGLKTFPKSARRNQSLSANRPSGITGARSLKSAFPRWPMPSFFYLRNRGPIG